MQEESRTDLVSLFNVGGSPPTEENISNLLANRYKRNLPYTNLGYSNLVVINPYQPLELLNDATLQNYAEIGYKDVSGQKQTLQPHVYELATRIYFHMRRTGEDQSIILSGITGSGKSTTRKHFLCELLYLSAHNKRESKLSTQIQNALVVFEAFGHARTSQNASASKFGLFQEIQFNERGRILGTKSMAYQFDKSRVTHVPQNERTYHVFYSLLAGTSLNEKTALHINFKPEYFHYLNQSGCITTPGWNDEIQFGDLKSALKACGFKAKSVTQIFQLLSAILHIGNLQFMEGAETLAQEACVVKNTDILDIVAVMLGVSPSKLETCLTYKLKLIGKEVCTMFLNPQAACDQRDDLSRALYNVLFLWIVESINRKVCYTGTEEPANVVGMMDQFGFQNFSINSFEEFCINLANERIHHFLVNENFSNDHGIHAIMIRDGVPLPTIKMTDHAACLELLIGKDKIQALEDATKESKKEKLSKSSSLALTGVAGLMDRDTARLQSGASDATNANFLATLQRQFANHSSLSRGSQTYSFGINHFSGTVHYSVDNFLEKNLDDLSPDFVNLLRESSSNSFLSGLFQGTAMATESHPKDDRTIVKAQLSRKPTRAPSMRRKGTKRRPNNPVEPSIPQDTKDDLEIKKAEDAYENMEQMTVVDQLYLTLRDITLSITDSKIYNVIHIRPNDGQVPEYDHNRVRSQIRAFLLPDLVARHQHDYANFYTFEEFTTHYANFMSSMNLHTPGSKQEIQELCAMMQWSPQSVFVGHEMVWLDFQVWKQLEDGLRFAEKEERAAAKGIAAESGIGSANASQPPVSDAGHDPNGEQMMEHYGYDDHNQQYLNTQDHGFDENASYVYSEDKREADGSQWGDESEWGVNVISEGFGPNMDMSKMIEDVQVPQIENIEEVPITPIRRWWVRFVWLCTFWIPSFCLRICGKMKRPDIQMAWREKVTLCMLIAFMSAIIMFVIVGLGEVLCPGTKNMYSPINVANHNTATDNYMSVRGVVYEVTKFAKLNHGTASNKATEELMTMVAGLDVSSSIPPPLYAACEGLVAPDSTFKITANSTGAPQASFVHYSGTEAVKGVSEKLDNPNWYNIDFLPNMKDYRKGVLVHSLESMSADAEGWGRAILSINDRVYDMQDYITTMSYLGPTYGFMPSTVIDIFNKYKGTDATKNWELYKDAMTPATQSSVMNCLDNYFYIGQVDPRETTACMFTNYMLLAAAALMCFVILMKFLAALQFGSAPTPEDHDKFVICQVPCYTEDEESLKKTIDSLTVMKYDDKRKLLFIVADGMVMGSGNDRPTPRIVLDILGYDTKNDPEPLMFKSVGEGAKQLNYGKVYSGLYECEGHVVPYIVIAKVGKASERAKPGNRGKRDSQMICMSFLNRVHFDGEMTPMELEMYHQIKNVIGVNPSFYEYVLMVDSDTEVMPQSLSYLISSMLHDGRIMGICGETALSNENESWTTMIQVYEYFISHHLAKAFESLFGSVTCLPGCFCMYRVRTPVKNEPLIISPHVVHAYADNLVDTLHKKNLLSLGEDRYLTTLMMKNFPQYKMKFTPYAMCRTVAPDKWRILLSQRRRWINSTIHNLLEVVLLPDLCGFCCFSMRFVVLIDLIGTLTLPVSFGYLVYLIYVMISKSGPFPTLAMAMLAGLYALQVLIFILKRQWQHIGWMVFYILALPIYSFFLPIYSFWHFDDFSWGNTRVVVGESQRKIIVTDEEKFDEKMIPLKKWSVYEQELWEMGSQGTRDTGMSGNTYNSYGGGVPPGYDNRSQYSSNSGHGADFDYYRDGKRGEKPRTRPSYVGTGSAAGSAAGSVVGSEYGGGGMSQNMMGDYNRSMMGTPSMMMQQPQMRPMSYASSAHPDYMSQIQPMMMDPAYAMMQTDMQGAGMYNTNSSHMSASFDHMGAPSPAFGSRPRNASYDRGSNLSATNLLGQQSEYDIPMGNVSQVSVPPMIPAGFPTDDEILTEIKTILATANLMSITKKQVREQLSEMFGFDMNFKKDFINTSIEYILQGRL